MNTQGTHKVHRRYTQGIHKVRGEGNGIPEESGTAGWEFVITTGFGF